MIITVILFIFALGRIKYTMNNSVPIIRLNSNYSMPQIGLGTYNANGAQLRQAIKDALEVGYRHIDTAEFYRNEKDVGLAVNELINAGLIKREDVFITTKVWPSGSDRQKTLDTIRNSLQLLNLTYVDLVLVHWPFENYAEMYKGLEDALNQKLTRSIGISNFDRSQIDNLLKTAKVRPSVNQIDIHPGLNQDDTIAYCNQLGISVTGYSPLGKGSLIRNPTLVTIGKKHNKSAAQVALRWQIQRGLVTIPKSVNKKYIKENFEIFDFELTETEMTEIHNMDRKRH